MMNFFEKESIILGFRLLEEGVDFRVFKNDKNKETLEDLLDRGLLVKQSGRVKLAGNVAFVSNAVLYEFMK